MSDYFQMKFTDTGDFKACSEAEKWCNERGLSVGGLQGPSPRGILLGSYNIQKWRNLSEEDKDALDGEMTGNMREGPVVVTLKNLPHLQGVTEAPIDSHFEAQRSS